MPDVWALAAIVAKFALYLGVLTSAGTVFVALIFQVRRIRGLVIGFGALGVIGTLLGFSLAGAALTGNATGMIDPEMLGLLWTTPVGTAFILRLLGLGAVILGMILGGIGLWISAAGGLVALWSFATIGHIPDRDLFWLNALLLIHLLAIAVWIGILTPLQRRAKTGRSADAADLGQRFGRIAMGFVPVLIFAGLVMSYMLVGSISALVGTAYGQALILKVATVAGLLGLAALNKVRYVPRLMKDDAQAARHLSISISAEWIAVMIAMMITSVLTSVLILPT